MDHALPAEPSTPSTAPRGIAWFPTITVVLGIAGLLYLRAMPELERNLKYWSTAGIPLLVIILNLVWFLFSRRFSGKARLTGLALVVLLVFGVKQAVRVDGTLNGTGLPRLAWKWSASAIPSVAIQPIRTGDAPSVDNTRLTEATDVPQFFGPNRDGVITGARLARDWKSTPAKELWRQPIGLGWSAFAVVQGRAYTQEQRGEDELVTCYDLFTGRLLWQHADPARFSQWQSGDGPHATPTIFAGKLYSYGATGLLNCLDAATGQKIWQRSVLAENQSTNIEWGVSASPLIVEDKVIVTGGQTQGPVLFAYDRETGQPLWKTGDDRASYASPIVATLAGRQVILSNNARGLLICDLATGAMLLDHTWGGDKMPKASQPVVLSDDRIFLSAGYGMGCQMLKITTAADGKLTATELWRGMRMKTQFNSPSVVRGYLYGIDDGRLACVDLATGNRMWKEGQFASGQSLVVDDLIIVQNESGPVHLVAAKPEGFEELGRIDALSSKTWNHPTLSGRFLLVRNDREVACYELPVQAK